MFAANSLIYLNQSFPPYAVSLNSITDISTEFILKPQPGVKITLDNANGAFIGEDKMVISLRGGELYVLTLIVDSMRVMKSFHLDKAAASVLTTCVSKAVSYGLLITRHAWILSSEELSCVNILINYCWKIKHRYFYTNTPCWALYHLCNCLLGKEGYVFGSVGLSVCS